MVAEEYLIHISHCLEHPNIDFSRNMLQTTLMQSFALCLKALIWVSISTFQNIWYRNKTDEVAGRTFLGVKLIIWESFWWKFSRGPFLRRKIFIGRF